MKTSLVLLAGAALAAAQSISDLPKCGQTCINNMLALGPSLGCKSGDVTCYCTTPDFGYGIRDCSNEACSSSAEAEQVISFGTAYCANVLSSAASSESTIIASSTSASGSGSAKTTASGASSSGASASSASGATKSTPLVIPISTETLTMTTSGSVIKETTTIVASGPGATAALSSASEKGKSEASSQLKSSISGLKSSVSAAKTSAAGAVSSAKSALSSAASAATSASGNAGAPFQTAAPALIGLAAIAALAL